jgi:hypothetical protein
LLENIPQFVLDQENTLAGFPFPITLFPKEDDQLSAVPRMEGYYSSANVFWN